MANKISNAQVIGVFPDKVKISISDIEKFTDGENIKVGSYIRITDNEDCVLIAAIENFSIESQDSRLPKYLIEAFPLGIINDGKFIRGGDALTIPPTGVAPATTEDIRKIFEDSIEQKVNFSFSKLLSNQNITVPVNGNKFFNKHIAIVGSTGSGKSHTISRILQNAISSPSKKIESRDGNFKLNNSHIVIFDIHSEYRTAFPTANILNVNNIQLPYWLLNSDELEEILLDTGERDNYNQSAIFRYLVTENKRKHNPDKKRIFYDSPLRFSIQEVLNAIYNIKNETINFKNNSRYMIIDDSYHLSDEGKTKETDGLLLDEAKRLEMYFSMRHEFHQPKGSNISKGSYSDGSLNKFFSRFESKIAQERLKFIFNENSINLTLENVLSSLIGYGENKSNITIIDLSGVPFEVLSITVSLISRLLFEYGYYYKVLREGEVHNNDAPLLLVYEEAHKYVPRSDLSKFRASKTSIERIAKEGRKYGVTLLLSSQRPAEISETIFAQCSNFLAMRLTNPNDQDYVSRLLPDTLGKLKDKLPNLGAGEALLIGESVVIPSLVRIDKCIEHEPSSNDIPYFELWKEEWKNIDFQGITNNWLGD
ncbi:MAG: hypothetical protein CENE_02287 [Candidatus Celerinatantimonas neptuna]|nr:MAG: hypothetical protein CENE_02287 [Candidatus Celerinatantimonas neptuna]